MRIEGDYAEHGFAIAREFISAEIAHALMKRIQKDTMVYFIPEIEGEQDRIIPRKTFEIYGNDYPPLQTFLWAMTKPMELVTGRSLLPTFDFYRVYKQGDVCRVHRDRPECEHSLSLTLAYSDEIVWPLELGRAGEAGPDDPVADEFGTEQVAAVDMNIGDAVAYKGTSHRHGRVMPNPNRWSAHLFMHWVDRDGPHADLAFDQKISKQPVDYLFVD